MSIIEMKTKIDTLAWGPQGTDELKAASAHPAPPMAIYLTFTHMRGRDDLDANEIEILRECCKMIRTNYWFGAYNDAMLTESRLPPPPAPPMPIATEGEAILPEAESPSS